jgi:hypothetical protein
MTREIERLSSTWRRIRRIRLRSSEMPPAWLTALGAEEGVERVETRDRMLEIHYDLRLIRLSDLVAKLADIGLLPDTGILQRVRLASWAVCEDIQWLNRDFDMSFDTVVREIYMSRYRHRRHGRRDDRPQHWRKYTGTQT